MDISEVAGKDRPIEFNDKGGGQSSVPVRFDLVDGKAMFKMCAVLHEGAEKYGANNWRLIDVDDHLNHLIMHAYAYLAGDRSDEHLSHIMCRAMFAQAVELQEEIRKPTFEPDPAAYVHFPTWDGSHWSTGVAICTAKGNIRWSTQREQVTCPKCLNAMTR